MQGSYDGNTISNLIPGASPVPANFKLKGGVYGFSTVGAAGASGSIDLQVLGPDNTTYVSVFGATGAFAAAGVATLTLPPGTYKWVIGASGATGVYARVSRVPGD